MSLRYIKCISCKFLLCEPPCPDDPYGDVRCLKGYWEGNDTEGRDLYLKEGEKDPWKFCKDYTPDSE